MLSFLLALGPGAPPASSVPGATTSQPSAPSRIDPAVRDGVFLYELRPWTPVNWERQVAKAAPSELFRFTTDDFWLNLHQFLYVLGRASNQTRDASRVAVKDAPADAAQGLKTVATTEHATWHAAVAFYAAGPSRLDAVFDAPLVSAGQALARARDAKDLSGAGLEPGLAGALTSVASIYRRAFWPAHQAANEAWVKELQPLLQAHGRSILAFITRAYATSWPASGYPARVTAYTNWAGAFSTDGELLLLSSRDPALRGSQALETVFHESMHQWDQQTFAAIDRAAKAQGVRVDDWLSHAMIFYTAGEATRREVPGHVPYAEGGVWARGRESLRQALIASWQPWLDQKITREEALADLVMKAQAAKQ
jgi:hypothetical protein